MAKKYITLVTTKGKEKIARASLTGNPVRIKTIKLGDGNGSSYLIDENQTSLKKVVYETNISSYKQDTLNPNTLYVESLIPSDVGNFYIREIGLFDDAGDLIVLSSYEETYKPIAGDGSTMELFIRTAIVLSNMSSVEVVVDKSIVLASKSDLDKIYKLIGDLGTASGKFRSTTSVASMLIELHDTLEAIELTDLKVKVTTWDNRTLDKVLSKIKGWIGTLTNLKTKEKSSLVGAVNEVHDNNENLKQAELLDRQDIVKIKSELTGEDEALRVNNEKFAHLLGVSIEDIRGGVS